MFEAARLHLLSDVIVARRRRCCGLSSWPNVAQSYAWRISHVPNQTQMGFGTCDGQTSFSSPEPFVSFGLVVLTN